MSGPEAHWRRVCGLHAASDGTLAAVWLAHDKDVDAAHLYDACVFKREVLAVIAEGVNCRGRWIPVAWEKGMKAMADEMLERGVRMLPDPYVEDEAMAEVMSRDIEERMRSGRFKVDKRLQNWIDELKSFGRRDGKIPVETFPLMAATRCAIANLSYARPQTRARTVGRTYPQIAVI